MTLTQTQAAMVVNGLPGVGPVARERLRAAFGDDLSAALEADAKTLFSTVGIGRTLGEKILNWRDLFDLEKEERALAAHGAQFIPFFDAAYPPLLKQIPDAPTGLYARGNADALGSADGIAIVGTRKASLYGVSNARKIAFQLAAAGRVVVSGGARGIDTAAHEAALEAGGKTIVVLGCGIDVVYPPENLELFRRIAQSDGVVISEFPFGKKADRRTFPQRNRVIAGIAAGTLVVESDLAGGSMITANFAADCGRTVFALPGRVEQSGSRGCHKLIREGAILATCAEDILGDLSGTPAQQTLALGEATAEYRAPDAALSDIAERVLAPLRDGSSLSPDEIAMRTGVPFPLVSANLLLLELDGVVARKTDGKYEIAH